MPPGFCRQLQVVVWFAGAAPHVCVGHGEGSPHEQEYVVQTGTVHGRVCWLHEAQPASNGDAGTDDLTPSITESAEHVPDMVCTPVAGTPGGAHVSEHGDQAPATHEYVTQAGDAGHGNDWVEQVNWPRVPPWLQKQQSTATAVASFPPVTLAHEHDVVRDPARAWETPQVAVRSGQGVSVHFCLYSTQGHVGMHAFNSHRVVLDAQFGHDDVGTMPRWLLVHCAVRVTTPAPHVTEQALSTYEHESCSGGTGAGVASKQGMVQEVVMVPHCVPPQSVRSATWFCLTPSTTVKHA